MIFRMGWFAQIPEETAQHSTKLMQLNYSYFKILKLKSHSLFLVTFFVPKLLDDNILLP